MRTPDKVCRAGARRPQSQGSQAGPRKCENSVTPESDVHDRDTTHHTTLNHVTPPHTVAHHATPRHHESLNRLGHPELIVRSDDEPAMLAFCDAVIRESFRKVFGVRAIAQAVPKDDSASAGMVETPSNRSRRKFELW